jgi:hypothetical protein
VREVPGADEVKIACVTPDNKRDYLCEQVLEGLHQLGHKLVISDPGNGFTKRAMLDGEFRAAADECDAMLVFFGKQRNNRPPRRYFLDQVKLPKSRIAYVDGSEWSATGWESGDQATASLVDPTRRRGEPWIDEEMLQRCGWYFKRETYPQDLQRGIIPLPFAMCQRHLVEHLPFAKRDIDVFCSFGHVKTGKRKEAIEVVKSLEGKHNVVVKAGMPKDEYLDHLRRSKIVIDAWGGGDTNDRFFEAVGVGACCLYQRYNVVMPNPFVDDLTAMSWASVAELEDRLRFLLVEEPERAEIIGSSGFAHALCYHEACHRAEEILKHVVP